MGAVNGTHEVDVEYLIDSLVGDLRERPRRGHSGVVDQNVQFSLGEPGGACGRGVSCLPVANVEGDAVGRAAVGANVLSDSRSSVRIEIADQYRRPSGAQRPGDRRADPAAGSGD